MKNWNIKIRVFKIADFISWQRAGTLNINPIFQRRPVWQKGAKSYLIDTISRGLPIPILFIREQKTSLQSLEAVREIVDGQQRIRTIFSYIDPTLLKDFNPENDEFIIRKNHNKELAGKKFNDLSDDLKQKILDYEFSVHVLPAQLDDREVLQIFSRMNSTGVKLNGQELRNAKWFGEFKTEMYNLASKHLDQWRKWNLLSEYEIARMKEVELTSELVIIITKGLSGRNPKNLNDIYEEKDETYPELKEVDSRFNYLMNLIDEKLGDYLNNSPFSNISLFHLLFAVLYDFSFGLNSLLDSKKKPKTINESIINKIKKLGDKISNKSLPRKELELITARQKTIEFIKELFQYFKSEFKNGN